MVQRFVDLNNRKKREDYERSSGGDPIKAFFVEVWNVCNDTSMNMFCPVLQVLKKTRTTISLNGAKQGSPI
jgi:hypothetical protein